MALLDSIIGPISKLLDRIIPDPRARDSAKMELLKLQGDQEMASLATQMQAIVAEAQSPDPWTSRARREVCAFTKKPVVASGGVSSLQDLIALRALTAIGVEGAIVGKALYAGAFTLPALRCLHPCRCPVYPSQA